jgi:hypothetical protein
VDEHREEKPMTRCARIALLLLAMFSAPACQSPTEPDEIDVTLTASPNPTTASGNTGRTYKVEGDDNEPDEIREYDWHSAFSVSLHNNDDVGMDITSVSVRVQQASGGIVIAPSGSETEKYEYNSQASGNRLEGKGSASMNFDVWYDLPNKGKEALVTISVTFVNDDDLSFSDTVQVRVAP